MAAVPNYHKLDGLKQQTHSLAVLEASSPKSGSLGQRQGAVRAALLPEALQGSPVLFQLRGGLLTFLGL